MTVIFYCLLRPLMRLLAAFLNFLVLLLTCLVSGSVRLIRGSIGFLMLLVELFVYRSMSFLPSCWCWISASTAA